MACDLQTSQFSKCNWHSRNKPATWLLAEVPPSSSLSSSGSSLLSALNVLLTLITVVWLHSEDKEMMLRWECLPQSLRGWKGAHLRSLTPERMLKMPEEKHLLTSNLREFSYVDPDDKIRKRSHCRARLLPLLPPGYLLKSQFLQGYYNPWTGTAGAVAEETVLSTVLAVLMASIHPRPIAPSEGLLAWNAQWGVRTAQEHRDRAEHTVLLSTMNRSWALNPSPIMRPMS